MAKENDNTTPAIRLANTSGIACNFRPAPGDRDRDGYRLLSCASYIGTGSDFALGHFADVRGPALVFNCASQ
jgi:hypothetical protein